MFAVRTAARSLLAPVARRAVVVAAPKPFAFTSQRFYSASALSADDIKSRIVEVLTSFEKVDSTKVRLARSLGQRSGKELTGLWPGRCPPPLRSPTTLDSTRSTPLRSSWPLRVRSSLWLDLRLSGRRLTLARLFSEEFSIEIPDEEADRITTVGEGKLTASFLPCDWSRAAGPGGAGLGARADRSALPSPAIDYISKSPEAH
jgi:hypothetical protein